MRRLEGVMIATFVVTHLGTQWRMDELWWTLFLFLYYIVWYLISSYIINVWYTLWLICSYSMFKVTVCPILLVINFHQFSPFLLSSAEQVLAGMHYFESCTVAHCDAWSREHCAIHREESFGHVWIEWSTQCNCWKHVQSTVIILGSVLLWFIHHHHHHPSINMIGALPSAGRFGLRNCQEGLRNQATRFFWWPTSVSSVYLIFSRTWCIALGLMLMCRDSLSKRIYVYQPPASPPASSEPSACIGFPIERHQQPQHQQHY